MLFHVVGRVFGFVPAVSFLYNQCLLQREGKGRREALWSPHGSWPTVPLQPADITVVFCLGFSHLPPKTPFLSELGAVGPWGHLSLAELTQLAPGRFGSQKYKPANSQLKMHIFIINTNTRSHPLLSSSHWG